MYVYLLILLDDDYLGQGLGKKLLADVLDRLRELGGRKLFVKVSDYKDESGNNVYAAATAMYKSFGFVEEVVSVDFYDEGENQTILGLELIAQADDIEISDEKPVIRFKGLFEIAETIAFSFSVPSITGSSITLSPNSSFAVLDMLTPYIYNLYRSISDLFRQTLVFRSSINEHQCQINQKSCKNNTLQQNPYS